MLRPAMWMLIIFDLNEAALLDERSRTSKIEVIRVVWGLFNERN
jgi:hypothetical protein